MVFVCITKFVMIYYSIIIPHKNTPNLLQYCLDSIPIREDVHALNVPYIHFWQRGFDGLMKQ